MKLVVIVLFFSSSSHIWCIRFPNSSRTTCNKTASVIMDWILVYISYEMILSQITFVPTAITLSTSYSISGCPQWSYFPLGFCDASEFGYVAVVHLDDTIAVSLLSVKVWGAPVKTISIPGDELCRTLLLSKLLGCPRQILESKIWLTQQIRLIYSSHLRPFQSQSNPTDRCLLPQDFLSHQLLCARSYCWNLCENYWRFDVSNHNSEIRKTNEE